MLAPQHHARLPSIYYSSPIMPPAAEPRQMLLPRAATGHPNTAPAQAPHCEGRGRAQRCASQRNPASRPPLHALAEHCPVRPPETAAGHTRAAPAQAPVLVRRGTRRALPHLPRTASHTPHSVPAQQRQMQPSEAATGPGAAAARAPSAACLSALLGGHTRSQPSAHALCCACSPRCSAGVMASTAASAPRCPR